MSLRGIAKKGVTSNNADRDMQNVLIKGNVQSDLSSIALLLFLYILQGIPLGLAGSIPMILQQRNISYKDQATFSLAFWPFSIKLLWAPIVDSCYFHWMGRRKSWLVPAQYLIGIFMLVLSGSISNLLGDDGSEPCILKLASIFFMLNFLAATQDIAVDGWALTILSKNNLGWASTCNSVGQTAGYFLGYVVFLALESKDFCINYLKQPDSIVTISGFFFFWGVVFLVTTTLVGLLKGEISQIVSGDEDDIGLVDTYKVLFTMLKMPSIQRIVLVLLSAKVAFAASDSLTVLKLTEFGVPKERLALLSIPLTPLQLLLPFIISKYTSGPKPMNTFLSAYIPRLCFNFVFVALIFLTPLFKQDDGEFSFYLYGLIVGIYLIHQVTVYSMFVSQMAFYAQISDPRVGGTYMTLLNTFTNLGGNWPAWVALRYVTELTWKSCIGSPLGGPCNTPEELNICTTAGGHCDTFVDGFYIESFILLGFGLIWYKWGKQTIQYLQNLPEKSWLVSVNKRE